MSCKNISYYTYLKVVIHLINSKIARCVPRVLQKSNVYLLLSCLIILFTSIYKHRQTALRATQNLEQFVQTVQLHISQEIYSLELIKNVPQDEQTLKLTVPEIIDFYPEYSCQVHEVVSSDGYVLQLHRIVKKNNDVISERVPVILQHGLLADSSNWVLNGGNRNSLGFALAESGRDVWLSNSRGNTYSRRHVLLDATRDAKFWDFSWYEMASIDVPAVIEYVAETTSSKQVDYIGHSQGSLTMLIALDKFEKVRATVRHFYALGPIAFLQNIKSPLAYLANSVFAPHVVYRKWLQEVLPTTDAGVWLSERIGGLVAGGHGTNFLTMLVGFHPKRYLVNKMATYLAHFTSGASMQTVLHFAQMIRTGRIQKYSLLGDDDVTGDLVEFKNINGVNITLFCGADDVFSDYKDIESLVEIVGKKNTVSVSYLEDFDHLSYLWGNTAFQDVYKFIIESIKWHEKSS